MLISNWSSDVCSPDLIGFKGIELGGKFPRAAPALKALLDRFGLALVGGWYGSALLDRTAEAEIAAMQPHLRLLQAMDTDVFVVAETSNAIHSDRSQPLSRTPRLDAAAWQQVGEIGRAWCGDSGSQSG